MSPAFAQPSDLAAGKACYRSGEFKQAAGHLERALAADPQNAESQYWLGRSYETLADIATPFGHRYRSRARTHLTKAAELAPGSSEYRQELFHFLLDSGGDPHALAVLLSAAESSPDYDSMRSSLDQTQRLNRSLDGRLTRLFQLATAWY
jgi:Flp pilus assembly protein TadD